MTARLRPPSPTPTDAPLSMPARFARLRHAAQRRLTTTLATGLVMGFVAGWLLPAASRAADCPPVAQAPSAEQMRAGAREARDRGLLWRFEKNGRVGWLYGTLHVGRLAWAFPGPVVTRALRAADTVALELDLSDPTIAQAMAQAIEGQRQREASLPLPPALRQRLQALAQAGCLEAAQLASQPLLIQAMALNVLSARQEGLDPAFGQEFALSGLARATGKTLVSMETPQSQLQALAGDSLDEFIAQLTETLDELETGKARRLLGRVAGFWERGDLDSLARPEHWCDCVVSESEQAQMRRINDARNPAMAAKIVGMHSQGRKVFAAVGALHMTGPQALPKLLEAQGFAVQRVPLGSP